LDGLEVSDAVMGLGMGAVRGAFSAGTGGSGPAQTRVPPGIASAAVLIALVPGGGKHDGDSAPASVVLIRRAAHLRANPGEIAFPGGRIEPGEEPLAAALREAEEEVALRSSDVEVLGRLSPLRRLWHSEGIIPYVAAARGPLELKANPEEVDEVLGVPLAELAAPGRSWQESWEEPGHAAGTAAARSGAAGYPTWTMHFFALGPDVIWGVTARMLQEFFLRVLRPREAAPPL